MNKALEVHQLINSMEGGSARGTKQVFDMDEISGFSLRAENLKARTCSVMYQMLNLSQILMTLVYQFLGRVKTTVSLHQSLKKSRGLIHHLVVVITVSIS